MNTNRTPSKPFSDSHPKAVKAHWRYHCKSFGYVPLKTWAKKHRADPPSILKTGDTINVAGWLSNKSANFSKPPLGIGRTNGKRKSKTKVPDKKKGDKK